MSDDLYIGPSTLAPGPKEPPLHGERVARVAMLPLLVIFCAVVLVFFVFYQPVRIDGPSMIPTLHTADRVLITRGAKAVQRGDVVVLIADEGGAPIELVKRVVGLPGDRVEVRGDVAYVNGTREPDRGQLVVGVDSTAWGAVTVPPGQLYVMGDNRAQSEDSRYIGTVPESGVMGTVVAVFAPIQRFRLVR